MNKLKTLIIRNLKEIIRDPLSSIFCIGFPVIMLVLMQLILNQMPNVPPNFSIEQYAPGICVFGYTFSMMFVAMIIAHDKNTEFINRLNLAPIKKSTYIFSYVLAMLPITLVQTVLFFAISLIFGLPLTVNTLLAFLALIFSAIFYILLGTLLGTISKNEKQVGPISSIFISVVGVLGGVFMPLANMGVFTTISNLLPFAHTTKLGSCLLSGTPAMFWHHLAFVAGYALVIALITFLVRKNKN